VAFTVQRAVLELSRAQLQQCAGDALTIFTDGSAQKEQLPALSTAATLV
jgi:hypothetical protein